MKIKLDTEFKTLKGETVMEGEGALTLKSVITGAVLMPNENLTGKEKANRYGIAVRVEAAGKSIELEVEEVALIKEDIGKFYSALVVGQAYEMLK
jgi:hypothetical protein